MSEDVPTWHLCQDAVLRTVPQGMCIIKEANRVATGTEKRVVPLNDLCSGLWT